jgi:serine/threonine protein kinase
MVERFQQEARVAARINHPNLVRVYDVLRDFGVYYLVMEFVRGETAGDRVYRTGAPLPEAEAAKIFHDAALALAELHDRGIVHRDIKPPNLLISVTGEVKVADLGLARPGLRRDRSHEERHRAGDAGLHAAGAVGGPVRGRSALRRLGPRGDRLVSPRGKARHPLDDLAGGAQEDLPRRLPRHRRDASGDLRGARRDPPSRDAARAGGPLRERPGPGRGARALLAREPAALPRLRPSHPGKPGGAIGSRRRRRATASAPISSGRPRAACR